MEKDEEKCLNNWSETPIILPIPLVALFLAQKEAGKLIALYVCYDATTEWHTEFLSKISISQTAEKLHWTKAAVIKYDKILRTLLENLLKTL